MAIMPALVAEYESDDPTDEERQTLQGQLRIPYALALLLPKGLLGLVVAASAPRTRVGR